MQKMPSVSPARTAAFDILLRVEGESSYAPELLHSGAYAGLSISDHALATQIVMGVLRWRSKLDQEIAQTSAQALKKLDLEILIALRIALYQFRWLDRIPQRAALNESVELVKRARKRSAAPFVNAVLRKLTQQPHEIATSPPDSPDSLALATAHPLWIVDRWIREYGFETARGICDFDQAIPRASIRLRTPDAEAQLLQAGIRLNPGRILSSARSVESGEITRMKQLLNRSIVIQDEGSQLVAALAAHGTKPGARILDCCAAPGGKALAIADQSVSMSITAVEVHPHRARRMKELLSVTNTGSAAIHVIAADACHFPLSSGFDRVLADVPCSGTGTLGRNPEIKWRLQPEDLADLHQRQVAILESALAQVGAGGRLIYSTCSLEKEENEDVVKEALAENQAFSTIDAQVELAKLNADGKLLWPDLNSLTRGPYLRTIPGIHPCDGFFAAILERT